MIRQSSNGEAEVSKWAVMGSIRDPLLESERRRHTARPAGIQIRAERRGKMVAVESRAIRARLALRLAPHPIWVVGIERRAGWCTATAKSPT